MVGIVTYNTCTGQYVLKKMVLHIREVSLHVKRERVRVQSDSGTQTRYTSRSRTLLGFATRRDVSADQQAHRYQEMT